MATGAKSTARNERLGSSEKMLKRIQSTVGGMQVREKGGDCPVLFQSAYYEVSPVPHLGKNIDNWIRSKQEFLDNKRAGMIPYRVC